MNFEYGNNGFVACAVGDCKRILVEGTDLYIEVDYDDVDHNKVEESVKRLIDLLAENWTP
jgi:hypothetical protein